MKGLFISIGESSQKKTGIGLKVRNQIACFNNVGLDCKEIIMPISNSKMISFLYRLPFFNVYPIWKYKEEFDDADYIYMRRPFVMNCHMRRVFKKIKKRNIHCKIIIEIPTYPYDPEYNTYKFKNLLIIKDKYNRKRLKGLVDKFAILTDEREIFGIPTIKIKNGIDINNINKKIYSKTNDDSFHICAVAAFKEWHGYERLIKGMSNYYKNGGTRKIICHFVGEGSELPYYKELVDKYHLNNYCIFHGFLHGKELDDIYNVSDLALGIFGMYKKNLNFSCDLKSREAVARGIPMATGCPTDIFVQDQYPYYIEYPNDNSDLDIQRLIDFRDDLYNGESPNNMIEKIRQYAYDNVTMESAMNSVIEYISK